MIVGYEQKEEKKKIREKKESRNEETSIKQESLTFTERH